MMSLDQAAAYLGVSRWTLEQFIIADQLRVIHPPRPNTAKAMRPRPTRGGKPSRPAGDRLRRVLVDRVDLDALADAWRNA